MRTFVRFSCLAALLTSEILGSDWNGFRGPQGAGRSTEVGLPTTWSDNANVAWKTALPGAGSSSPSVFGDRIFLTAWTGYGLDLEKPGEKADLRLHVICLDRATGVVQWDESLPASEQEQDMTPRLAEHGYATPTPVCDNVAVYAYFGTTGLVAFDHRGRKLWQSPTGLKTAGFGCATSPVLFEDLVLVNASIEADTVFAFDRKTGRKVWERDGINRSWSTPTLGRTANGETELIVNHLDFVKGLNPRTGEILWTCSGIDDYVVPVVLVDDGIAYCLGGRTNRCLAIRLGGRGDVSETHRLWKINVGANVTSPVIHEGRLFWASDKGIACCVDAKTGKIEYQERLPTRARIYASVVLGDGKLYVTTRDSGVVVLDAVPEYKELARNVFEKDTGFFNAGPAIHGGQILLRSNSFLYCLGESRR